MRKHDALDERTKTALKALRDDAIMAYSELGFTVEELSQAFNITEMKIKSLSNFTGQRSNPLTLVTAEGREAHWQRVEYLRSMFTQEAHRLGCSDDAISFMLGKDVASSTLSLRKRIDELKVQNEELKTSYKELEELARQVVNKGQKWQAEVEQLKKQRDLWS